MDVHAIYAMEKEERKKWNAIREKLSPLEGSGVILRWQRPLRRCPRLLG